MYTLINKFFCIFKIPVCVARRQRRPEEAVNLGQPVCPDRLHPDRVEDPQEDLRAGPLLLHQQPDGPASQPDRTFAEPAAAPRWSYFNVGLSHYAIIYKAIFRISPKMFHFCVICEIKVRINDNTLYVMSKTAGTLSAQDSSIDCLSLGLADWRSMNWNSYHRLGVIYAWLEHIAQEYRHVEMIKIGETEEKRDLIVVKV